MANGCRIDKPGHDYDPVSGWCLHNCGHRDDGRIVVNGIEKYPGPDYPPDQLLTFIKQGQTA